MDSKIKFSIITANFNSGNDLEKTIQSVISQNYENKEYIIIDGNSTDNSRDIIDKYRPFLDKIVIESDEGIYHAMNKGIKKATGDFLYFLNCGDYLYNPSVLQVVADKIQQHPEYDIFWGDIVHYTAENSFYINAFRKDYLDIVANSINHQSMIIKRTSFQECGHYDVKYKIFADYDWLLRSLSKFNKKIFYLDMPIAYYLIGGYSTQQGKKRYWEEKNSILKQNTSKKQLLQFALCYPKYFFAYLFY